MLLLKNKELKKENIRLEAKIDKLEEKLADMKYQNKHLLKQYRELGNLYEYNKTDRHDLLKEINDIKRGIYNIVIRIKRIQDDHGLKLEETDYIVERLLDLYYAERVNTNKVKEEVMKDIAKMRGENKE